MRFIIKHRYQYILCIAVIAVFVSGNALGQDAKKKTVRSKVEFFKDQEKNERLVTTLKVKEDRNAPLENVYVHYFSVGDTSQVLLDSVLTNSEGEAILAIENLNGIYVDSAGLMEFHTMYFGSTSHKSVSRDIEILRADINLTFFQKDTVKYILVDANELRLNKTVKPIEGVDIIIYIKGTFSLLTIGEEETDAEGKAIMEFPIDMPGDTLGVLTIVSKIEEDDLYGNIVAQGKMNWGKPVPLAIEMHRGLGDTDAPLWMVYTLIVLLSAVWFHYFYIIFMIVKIKLTRTQVPSKLEFLNS